MCVCAAQAHTHNRGHTHTHTRRWQRNLAGALICRLDAGLSFLLAATLCYRSSSPTLEMITFTWREQLTDNIIKTFLLLEGPSKCCLKSAVTLSPQSAAHAHTHKYVQTRAQRQRNMTAFCLLGNYNANNVTVWSAACPKLSEAAARLWHTHTHTEISIATTAMQSEEVVRRMDADVELLKSAEKTTNGVDFRCNRHVKRLPIMLINYTD